MASTRSNAIITPDAPKPNGNYSHAITVGDTLHMCGFMGDDPATGEVKGDIEEQTVSFFQLALIVTHLIPKRSVPS